MTSPDVFSPKMMKAVTLITDGACIGNPGRGGWACLLRYNHHTRELYGSEPHTTNNRMELTAVTMGLNALNEACDVTIVTDSEYVQKGITEWMPGWKRKGWQTADKKPVKNQDLWKALDEALVRHRVSWQWVKGHGVHADNIRVDKLANAAARSQTAAGSIDTENN
jgi:ribonuclease HI